MSGLVAGTTPQKVGVGRTRGKVDPLVAGSVDRCFDEMAAVTREKRGPT